jgi:hypothetical protein
MTMLSANYTKSTTTSIAGASGNGAVTLTQITGYPLFSSALGSTKRFVRYEIEDTVNHKLEVGIGSVASDVLTRTTPQMTWDGTTFTDIAPSALAFGSSPASGNIVISLGPTAEQGSPLLIDVRQATIAGDANWRDYPISAQIDFTGNGSGGALTQDRENYAAYELITPGVLAGFQCQVSTNVAASHVKWALYDVGTDGLPGQKLIDGNLIDSGSTGIKTDTTTGTWTITGTRKLEPGWYYVGLIASAAVSLNGTGGATSRYPTPLGRKDGYGYGQTCWVAGNYTTGLPAAPSLGSGTIYSPSSNTAFWAGLKVTAS